MPRPKGSKNKKTEAIKKIPVEKPECCNKAVLIDFLNKRLPSMFDRDPAITGNLDKLAEDIISLTK